MPYIKQARRDQMSLGWVHPERALSLMLPQNAGELNYLFTRIALDYFKRNHNYAGINDIVGALEGCKLEFYRRYVCHYEEEKIAENGDVS